MRLADILKDRFDLDVRDVAGATVAGEIPMSNDAANRLIAGRLRDHPRIAALRVEAHAGDAVTIELQPRVRMMPPVRIIARVEHQPVFPENPTLVIRWSMPVAGPLAMFAAPMLSFFKALPPGVRMDGDRLAIDVGDLLRARGHGDLLALVRRVTVHTRPGAFIARFELGL